MGDINLDIDAEAVKQTREVIEQYPAKTQIDPELTKMILEQLGVSDEEARKEAVILILTEFTWTQRLYFIVRSAVMGVLGAGLMAIIVFLLGRVDAIQVALISVASFIATLAITRLFDKSLTRSSKKLVSALSNHKRLRMIVLSRF